MSYRIFGYLPFLAAALGVPAAAQAGSAACTGDGIMADNGAERGTTIIDQRGASAEAEVTQDGACNATELAQAGAGNRAAITQSGSGNRAVVRQGGTGE